MLRHAPPRSIHLNKGNVTRSALSSYQLDERCRSTTKKRMDLRGSGEAGGGVGAGETGMNGVNTAFMCEIL